MKTDGRQGRESPQARRDYLSFTSIHQSFSVNKRCLHLPVVCWIWHQLASKSECVPLFLIPSYLMSRLQFEIRHGSSIHIVEISKCFKSGQFIFGQPNYQHIANYNLYQGKGNAKEVLPNIRTRLSLRGGLMDIIFLTSSDVLVCLIPW